MILIYDIEMDLVILIVEIAGVLRLLRAHGRSSSFA